MSTYSTHPGFGFAALRATLRLPQRLARWDGLAPVPAAPAASWLERLASWAERQPEHRRLGSYTQGR
jgi:hypothetical protein